MSVFSLSASHYHSIRQLPLPGNHRWTRNQNLKIYLAPVFSKGSTGFCALKSSNPIHAREVSETVR